MLAGAVLGWKTRYEAEQAVARAREEARRRHRRLGFLAFGALVGLALASALAVFAFSQRSEAREQARDAKAGQLVASSLSMLGSDPELALELAREGAALDPTPRAEEALRLSLDASRQRAVYDVGHPVVELDVSPRTFALSSSATTTSRASSTSGRVTSSGLRVWTAPQQRSALRTGLSS